MPSAPPLLLEKTVFSIVNVPSAIVRTDSGQAHRDGETVELLDSELCNVIAEIAAGTTPTNCVELIVPPEWSSSREVVHEVDV